MSLWECFNPIGAVLGLIDLLTAKDPIEEGHKQDRIRAEKNRIAAEKYEKETERLRKAGWTDKEIKAVREKNTYDSTIGVMDINSDPGGYDTFGC